MKIIDAHLHFNPEHEHFRQLSQNVGYEYTEPFLLRKYQELGIVHAILMTHQKQEAEFSRYAPIFSFCAGVDYHALCSPDRQSHLDWLEKQLRNPRCAGLKLYPGYSSFVVGDPVFNPVYELAEQYEKPVAIHTGATAGHRALLKYSHPLTVDEPATRFPRVSFVICHIGNPWVLDTAAVLDKNPNVFADLSGLLEGLIPEGYYTEQSGYLDYLRTWLAYPTGCWERYLFGTDFPLVSYEQYIDFCSRLIPPAHHEDFFWKNAARVYRLEV